MIVKWLASDLHACGHIRGELMAREINKNLDNIRIDMKTCVTLSDYYKTDIMVFQRCNKEDMFNKLKLAKENKIKCIYDVDDDLFHMPPSFNKPYEYYSQPKVRQQIVDFLDGVDAIVCSTEELAKSTAIIVPDKPMYIVENSIDLATWDKANMSNKKCREFTIIGWMASASHIADADQVRDVLEIIMQKYPYVALHFIGWIDIEHLDLDQYKDRIIVEDWVQIEQLPYAMQTFDINICPLETNQFNRCKSNVKYLQGSALGIPSVCSDLVPYNTVIEQGVDGFLAKDPASWLASLSLLIENEQLRNEVGLRARAKVLEKYDMGKNFMQWANVFERVMRS